MNATLSLAIIVRDVENTLDRCLESFKQCVDEIILVDTGSVDKTVEIAKKYTDKIFHFPWIDDFSAARNFSFEKCTTDFILWCCHPDTLIHTEIGLIPISKISLGVKVLTHKGIYSPVTKIYTQDYDGDIYKIRSHFSEKDIKVTPNHEFLSTHGIDCKTGVKFCTPNCKKQWSKRNLKKNGKLLRQCKQLYQEYDFKYNPVKSLKVDDVIAYPRRKQTINHPFFIDIDSFNCKHRFPKQIELTPELMRLIGYYVAEGTSGKGYCSFCFHKDEIKYHDDVFYLMKKIFNMKGKKYLKGNRCNITFTSTVIANFFYSALNGLQPTRSLPDKWLNLSDRHLIEFLKSYYRGDGDDCSDSFRMTTTSYRLVYQIREILSRFGISPNIIPYQTKRRDAWKICIGGAKKKDFEQIISEKHSRQYSYLNRNKFYYSDENYIYSPISKKDREHYKGKVYNLEVEEGHTYVTDHLVCHNCDGDDYILPADIKKIRELDLSDKEIVLFNYIYAHDEFGANKSVVPRERIIKRSLGLKWQGAIHEVILLQGKQHVTDIETHHNKQHGTSERNLTILEKIVEKDPSSRNLYYLGKEYIDFNRIDEAINNLLKFLESPGAFWENVFQAHYKLANCYLIKEDEEKFIYHIFESIKLEDRQAEPFYFLGLFYMNKQKWQRATRWFDVCLQMERPKDLLSPYQPEYYTWLPALNACVCYNATGEIQKAYDRNQKVIQYRPKDPRAINNEKILVAALKKQRGLRDGEGKKLNLGSGGKPLEGYVSVDLFESPNVDEIFDMGDIPYQDNTIGGIYSEHSLEHVSFKKCEAVLQEWFRVLQPGGQLELYMPDFEKCCEAYLKAPLEDPFFMRTRAWFKHTVYGIQESQGGEPDEAQFHTCGFSKEEIRTVLERNGFIINSVSNYGGPGQKKDYCTPSMAITAVKPGEVEKESEKVEPETKITYDSAVKLKVGWVSNENWVAAQTRIRVLRVNEWLQEHGYDSHLVTYPEFLKWDYDIAIVGKMFNEEHLNNIKVLKEKKKLVYADLCEDVVDWAWVNEILALCDKVICCSDALADRVKPINPNVVVIEDAYETN